MPSCIAIDPRNTSMTATRFATHAGRIARGVAAVGLALLGAALVGCASLPATVQRAPSSALERDDATALGHLAAAAAPEGTRLSGLRPLADGHHAPNPRPALSRHAPKAP